MINMKIENLKEGMVIKNYKELCELLEIKYTTGGAKQNQLIELKTWCKYHKEGKKFIIDEIYDKQIFPEITMEDIFKSKNNKYIKSLANIILDYLHNEPKEVSNITINKLFTLLGITNTNYEECNYYRKELSQLYDIRLASIYYFYSNTKMEFKTIIERCLNNLKNRRVLNWYKVIMIRDPTTGQIYKADKQTEKMIINTEKEALKYLGINNMYELMKNRSKLKEFNDIISKETNINYFYAYDLVIGEQALRIEYNNVLEEKKKLNSMMINKTNKIFDKDRFKLFQNDYKRLNELLIDIANNELDIEELKKKRDENNTNYIKESILLDIDYENSKNKIKEKYTDIYE